jgi:hypothetical protein
LLSNQTAAARWEQLMGLERDYAAPAPEFSAAD